MDLFVENESIIVFRNEREDIDLEDLAHEENISGRLFRRLYRNKHIYINGEFRRKGLKLEKGDIVSMYMEDEINDIIPEEMELDIIYEDFDLLILNKGPDMVVHPTATHQNNTLSNGIAYYFNKNKINKKIRLANRLDKDTTGLIIVAKNPFAHQQLSLQFEDDTVGKRYLALVDGIVENNHGTIDLPIDREEKGSMKKMVKDTGQDALTTYWVKERLGDMTLVDIRIFTGRSHQIRVHMNYIEHPILGDTLYNKKSIYINRQALHSYYLKLKHPRTKKIMEFTAPLPKDMEKLINIKNNN